MTFLSVLSLREEENSSSKGRTMFGGVAHAALHGVPFILSMTGLHVFSGSSEFSLGLIFVLSGLLALLGAARFIMGFMGSPEGKNTRTVRNLLSTVLLAAVFAALGQNDVDGRALDRDALAYGVVLLTCVAKLGDVLANKVDALIEDDESKDKDFVNRQRLTWVLILLSLGALVSHKAAENTSALSFDNDRAGLSIGAIIVLGVHLLLNPLNWLYIKLRPDSQMIPLTRNPLIRHLTTSTGISFLAYVLGHVVASDEKYIWLLSSLSLYIIADATGRGRDVVAL